MDRQEMIGRVAERGEPWDMVIVGGGATGVGVALDAASRGYNVVLLEQSDFGKATSSRSTKLVHGGVRYLQQGNISLVMEALKERGILRNNAPHLVHDLAFVVPNYDWWEAPFYGIGMKVYDMLAGKYGFGKSKLLSSDEVAERIPTVERKGLRGGVLYYDGQFDDARLLVSLAQTAAQQGATLVNYCQVAGLLKDDDGFVNGVTAQDLESGDQYELKAKCVINATGAFSDGLLQMDEADAEPIIAPSQGVHLVLDGSFLPGETAIMVPRTNDGRVMFAIPWHGHALLGTTDTPIEQATLEPRPMEEEIDFILTTARDYLHKAPGREDVLSTFAGIRPLVKAGGSGNGGGGGGGGGGGTAALSRDHTIHITRSGLLTIAGGKWTTYRKMAADCVDHAATLGKLDERECVTKTLNIRGYHTHPEKFGDLAVYGSDAPSIQRMMETDAVMGERLTQRLPVWAAQVVWAVRFEMARTVDDVLARRIRALFLDAQAAIDMAPKVAKLMAKELGQDDTWEKQQVADFTELAKGYLIS